MTYEIDYVHSADGKLIITLSVPIEEYCATQALDINTILALVATEVR
jgi:hypothetical protein